MLRSRSFGPLSPSFLAGTHFAAASHSAAVRRSNPLVSADMTFPKTTFCAAIADFVRLKTVLLIIPIEKKLRELFLQGILNHTHLPHFSFHTISEMRYKKRDTSNESASQRSIFNHFPNYPSRSFRRGKNTPGHARRPRGGPGRDFRPPRRRRGYPSSRRCPRRSRCSSRCGPRAR